MPIPPNELAALRVRVERLLRNEKSRPDDLTALFLALRDYSGGRECVVEIGNFVAHRGERTRGIITREARDFFRTTRFYTDYTYQNKPLDLFDLPQNFSALIESAFRRTGTDLIRRGLKIKRQEAEKRLIELQSRVQPDSNGKTMLFLPTDSDRAFISTVLGHITSRPAFTNDQLTVQLFEALQANGLIFKSELSKFRKLGSMIGLFAVANMHLCVIDLEDGNQAELMAGATLSEKIIEVGAASEVKGLNPTGKVLIRAAFFTTQINVFDSAEVELHPPSDQQATWSFPIEISPAGKLARLS